MKKITQTLYINQYPLHENPYYLIADKNYENMDLVVEGELAYGIKPELYKLLCRSEEGDEIYFIDISHCIYDMTGFTKLLDIAFSKRIVLYFISEDIQYDSPFDKTTRRTLLKKVALAEQLFAESMKKSDPYLHDYNDGIYDE